MSPPTETSIFFRTQCRVSLYEPAPRDGSPRRAGKSHVGGLTLSLDTKPLGGGHTTSRLPSSPLRSLGPLQSEVKIPPSHSGFAVRRLVCAVGLQGRETGAFSFKYQFS